MMNKTYTIAELEALPDADLCALAAELRYGQTDGFPCWNTWTPATNRNQSGELLEWLTRRYWTVDVGFGLGNIVVIAMIDDGEFDKTIKIPGNTARSETIAFCAAMLAQQGRLK